MAYSKAELTPSKTTLQPIVWFFEHAPNRAKSLSIDSADINSISEWLENNKHSVVLLPTQHHNAHLWAKAIALMDKKSKKRLGWYGSLPLRDVLDVLALSSIGRYHHQAEKALKIPALAAWQEFLADSTLPNQPTWLEKLVIEDNMTIESDTEIHETHHRIRQWAGQLPTVNELCTAALEAINNAAYHGPEHGQFKKCTPYQALSPRDSVHLSLASTDIHYLMWVDDQWGRLSTEHILPKLQRHFSGEGLLDEGGRGHFLITQLIAGWMVIVMQGITTRYVLWEQRQPDRPQESLWLFA